MNHQELFINYIKFEKRYSQHTVVAYERDLNRFVDFCTSTVGVFDINTVDAKLVRNDVSTEESTPK